MEEQRKVSVEECEEICARLLDEARGVTDKAFLWHQAWLRLAAKVGQADPMLPPRDPNADATAESRISTIRGEMFRLLEGRTPRPADCMKVFDRINDVA